MVSIVGVVAQLAGALFSPQSPDVGSADKTPLPPAAGLVPVKRILARPVISAANWGDRGIKDRVGSPGNF
jgi:hypothetical protein